jgi:hypothetical protein
MRGSIKEDEAGTTLPRKNPPVVLLLAMALMMLLLLRPLLVIVELVELVVPLTGAEATANGSTTAPKETAEAVVTPLPPDSPLLEMPAEGGVLSPFTAKASLAVG